MTMRLLLIGLVLGWRVAAGQGEEWVAAPPHPTVGDTVWLDRQVGAPPGWRLRPGKLTAGEDVESLGDAVVLRVGGAWVVRYPVVAWSPGAHEITLPPIWRLAPDGRADSLAGGAARLEVTSVIPDSLRQPAPKAAIAPLRLGHRGPLLPIVATMLAALLGGGALAWRRRPPRQLAPAVQVPLEREVPDARWLAAGEPKAVAARAAGRLRAVIARGGAPPAPARVEMLEQLEQVEFAAAPETDVAALASRARALSREPGS